MNSSYAYFSPFQMSRGPGNAMAAAGAGRTDPAAGTMPGDGRRVDGRSGSGTEECQTCKNRKYKDGSNDPGVSFKTATHLDPATASYAIRAHEGEHVAHAWADAAKNDKEIVSQSVTYHTDICPECGRTYMSGGTTRTVTRSAPETYEAEKVERGRFIDVKA